VDEAGRADSATFGLRFALRYTPSLQVLAQLEAASGRTNFREQPLVVGNPAMPQITDRSGLAITLTSLPGAEVEGKWIASRLRTAALSGQDASEVEVSRRLEGATLVHLATHGFAYSTDARARDSFIALAPGGGEDGLLRVSEVLDGVEQLTAELVVLSACQSGLGDLKQAEGTVGLQRAFLARGARGVLVSQWSVSDEATAELMRQFYEHWLSGSSKAEALRLAQSELARDRRFAHPRFWAAFQLVGAR
jgi:CHAT domain-containing protein